MQCHALIQSNIQVVPGYYYMEILAPKAADQADPGQFLHVKVTEGNDPLLRRPLSLHTIDRTQGTLGLLYQVRGKGTQALARRQPGEKLDIMGPLGKGFMTELPYDQVVLVGGGIGTAPLYPLAEELIKKGKDVTVLLGFRSQDCVLFPKRFQDLGCQVQIATDDGSQGHHGFVSELLEKMIQEERPEYVYTCGPEKMMAGIVELCSIYGISGQVSMEAYMGCGVGACLSCCCETKNSEGKKYAKVCTDGPVFYLEEVRFHE